MLLNEEKDHILSRKFEINIVIKASTKNILCSHMFKMSYGENF